MGDLLCPHGALGLALTGYRASMPGRRRLWTIACVGMSDGSNVQPLRPRLREALRAAMKARDLTAVAALRMTLGAIDNAEAVDVSDAPSPKGGVIAGAVTGLGAGEATRRSLSER